MKFRPKRHRISVSSRENTDQFFSAPSSLTGTPILHPLESRMPSRSDHGQSSGPMMSAPAPNHEDAPAQGWNLTLPFASNRWSEIGYRYLSPKPLLSLLRRGLTGSEPAPRDPVHGTAVEEPENPVNTPNTALLVSPAKSPSPSPPDLSQQGPTTPAMGSVDPPGVPLLTRLDGIRVTSRTSHPSTYDIVRNVRAYLSDKRHTHCTGSQQSLVSLKENRPPNVNSSSENYTSSSDRAASAYIITTSDIMSILDIVMKGLQEAQDRQPSPSGSLLKLLPRSPTDGPKAIFPRASFRADPTTTVSSVQPTFSPSGGVDDPRGCDESRRNTPRATFISRRSIIEVD